jgi:nitrogen regulatory protein PII
MKMVMIVYNEALDEEVMQTLGHCGLENYTKLAGVFGRGTTSGTHLGNDIWPGRNNVLYVACRQDEAKNMLSCVEELRQKLGREGIKAFILPLEEVT